jgi:hypothetical protein
VKRADTRQSAAGRRSAPRRTGLRPRTLAGAAFVLVLAGSLTGCSAMSPATIETPYDASDGVNVDLGQQIGLRNFLVVAKEKGAPAAVLGSVVNDSDQETTVELTAQLGETTQPSVTRISVPAQSRVLIVPGGRQQMIIPELPVEPGAVLDMSAAAADAGATYFEAPVVPAAGSYSSLTAPPTTAPPTPTPAASPSGTQQPTGSPTVTPTGQATSTP